MAIRTRRHDSFICYIIIIYVFMYYLFIIVYLLFILFNSFIFLFIYIFIVITLLISRIDHTSCFSLIRCISPWLFLRQVCLIEIHYKAFTWLNTGAAFFMQSSCGIGLPIKSNENVLGLTKYTDFSHENWGERRRCVIVCHISLHKEEVR